MSKPVLLVQSDAYSSDEFSRLLQGVWNVDIHCANTLAQAKELLKKHRQDYLVAVCDLKLSDGSADEVLNLMEKASVKCIALTNATDKKYADILSKPNLIDYITKETANAFNYAVGLVGRIYKNQFYKVLVVEDSLTAAIILEEMLNLLNFQVYTARNGVEALDTLAHHPDIRLAITDFEMPQMNGFEFTVRARETWTKDKLAIIGLSASGQSDLGSMFIKNGANDFLFKPYSFEELLCRINTNIEAIEHLDYIYELANKDALTKLFNRRFFFSSGNQKYTDGEAANSALTVVMFDIDFFKKVNDTWGHDGGDAVLIHFASVMQEHFHQHLFARLGGEEFAVIVEGLDKPQVEALLEGFRQKIENSVIPWAGKEIRITTSTGATARYNGSLDAMLKTADENLYAAKEGGRNRVVLTG